MYQHIKDRVIYSACNQSNRISYTSFCHMGGVNNPRLVKSHRTHGQSHWTTYHMMQLEPPVNQKGYHHDILSNSNTP